MTIGTVQVSESKEDGSHLIVASKEECQLILDVFTKFCEQNPRMKKAEKMLTELEAKLQCF